MTYHESQQRIAEAEAAQRDGDVAKARALFFQAAELQRKLIASVPDDRVRTKSVFGLSVATLLYKADKLDESERYACHVLSHSWVESYSAVKLRELVAHIWDERVLRSRKIERSRRPAAAEAIEEPVRATVEWMGQEATLSSEVTTRNHSETSDEPGQEAGAARAVEPPMRPPLAEGQTWRGADGTEIPILRERDTDGLYARVSFGRINVYEGDDAPIGWTFVRGPEGVQSAEQCPPCPEFAPPPAPPAPLKPGERIPVEPSEAAREAIDRIAATWRRRASLATHTARDTGSAQSAGAAGAFDRAAFDLCRAFDVPLPARPRTCADPGCQVCLGSTEEPPCAPPVPPEPDGDEETAYDVGAAKRMGGEQPAENHPKRPGLESSPPMLRPLAALFDPVEQWINAHPLVPVRPAPAPHAARAPQAKLRRPRASWDDYFMRIAEVVASRATCDRKHVGAVIVRDKSILATGYNGSIRGLPHCDEEGHLIEDNHCVRTVHAEANAIVQAARNGVRIDGAAIYVTAVPCWGCFRLVANAGLTRVVFGEAYRLDEKVARCAAELGIELVPLESP